MHMKSSVKYLIKMKQEMDPLSIYFPVFQEDRNTFLKEYYQKFPSMYKFIKLGPQVF